MRKILAILLVLVLIVSMAVPVFAATPKLSVKVPQISSIQITPKIDCAGAVSSWLAEHPINIKITVPAVTLGG